MRKLFPLNYYYYHYYTCSNERLTESQTKVGIVGGSDLSKIKEQLGEGCVGQVRTTLHYYYDDDDYYYYYGQWTD